MNNNRYDTPRSKAICVDDIVEIVPRSTSIAGARFTVVALDERNAWIKRIDLPVLDPVGHIMPIDRITHARPKRRTITLDEPVVHALLARLSDVFRSSMPRQDLDDLYKLRAALENGYIHDV